MANSPCCRSLLIQKEEVASTGIWNQRYACISTTAGRLGYCSSLRISRSYGRRTWGCRTHGMRRRG